MSTKFVHSHCVAAHCAMDAFVESSVQCKQNIHTYIFYVDSHHERTIHSMSYCLILTPPNFIWWQVVSDNIIWIFAICIANLIE